MGLCTEVGEQRKSQKHRTAELEGPPPRVIKFKSLPNQEKLRHGHLRYVAQAHDAPNTETAATAPAPRCLSNGQASIEQSSRKAESTEQDHVSGWKFNQHKKKSEILKIRNLAGWVMGRKC